MLEISVGQTIRNSRIQKKMTLEDLAAASSLAATHLDRIELAKLNARLITLLPIAEALSMRLHELFNEGGLEPDYTVVERFTENNLPPNEEYDASYLQIDDLGYTLLEKLTILDIEHGAGLAPTCRFQLFPDQNAAAASYGITVIYKYQYGLFTQTIRDISVQQQTVKNMLTLLNRLRPSRESIMDILEDFINGLYMMP